MKKSLPKKEPLSKLNEMESITTLAAKSFAGVLAAERKGEEALGWRLGRRDYNSLEDARDAEPENLTWAGMGRLEDQEPGSFAILWERLKDYARDELESGQRAAAVAVGTHLPLDRARFLVLREKYIREWEPRNVLESQMIDAICQAQTIREYWMTLATGRLAAECEQERFYIMVRGQRSERYIDGSQSAREAQEQAERWDRVFTRSVRALRDLRRYTAPVIVNNQGGQVNVASEGGQQVNLQNKKPRKKPAKKQNASANKRKRSKSY